MRDANGDITALLERWSEGDRSAFEQLVPIVYSELRNLAAIHLRREQPGSTLQPTALVHEIYLQFVDQRRVQYNNRSHFFGAAASIIRRVLVDHARARKALKRGGDVEKVAMNAALAIEIPDDVDLEDLDAALNALEQFDRQKAKVVELRYFAGLSIPEAAEVMGLSPSTLKREWSVARAWLYERLNGEKTSL